MKSPKNPIELNDILGYLTGLIKDSDMVYSFQTSQIRLTSSEKVSWTLDGEYGGDHTQVTVEDHHKALEIIVE